jgi:hypothetical protein
MSALVVENRPDSRRLVSQVLLEQGFHMGRAPQTILLGDDPAYSKKRANGVITIADSRFCEIVNQQRNNYQEKDRLQTK